MKPYRRMLPIPVSAARHIAHWYGYDQVIVIARRVGGPDDVHGEHVTTCGIDAEHSAVAARIGDAQRVMGWPAGVFDGWPATDRGAGPAPGPDNPPSPPARERAPSECHSDGKPNADVEHVPHGTVLPAPEIPHD